jgi:hypothetical protein
MQSLTAPFSAPYFQCASQWAKLPWLVLRLTTPVLSSEFLIHFLALHRLSPVTPQAHAAPTAATQCCNKVVVWPDDWFSMAHNGELLALSRAIGDTLHDNHCAWRSQGPRVLTSGGGSPSNAILSGACTAVKVDIAGSPACWALPPSRSPSQVEQSVVSDWSDTERSDSYHALLGIAVMGLRRTSKRLDVLWPFLSDAVSPSTLLWSPKTKAPLNSVGEYDLDCSYCGCITQGKVDRRTAAAASEVDGSDQAAEAITTAVTTVTVDVNTAHHSWCMWRKHTLASIVPQSQASSPIVVHVSPAAQIVVIGGVAMVDALVDALRVSRAFASEVVMRHPCWSYNASSEVASELIRMRKASHHSIDAAPLLRSWAARVPQSSLIVGINSPNNSTVKHSEKTSGCLEEYLTLRTALLAPRTQTSRKRPREEGEDHTEAPDGFADEDPQTVEDCIRVWETRRKRSDLSQQQSNKILQPVLSTAPSHALSWDLIRDAVGEEPRTVISAEARARVDTFLSSVRQAVMNAQVTRVAAPVPQTSARAPLHHPPVQQQHHHHHHHHAAHHVQRPPLSGPLHQHSGVPPYGSPPFPLAPQHPQHRAAPYRPQQAYIDGGKGLFEAPVMVPNVAPGGVLSAPVLAAPIFGQAAPHRAFPTSTLQPSVGRNSGDGAPDFGGSVLGVAPPAPNPAFRNAASSELAKAQGNSQRGLVPALPPVLHPAAKQPAAMSGGKASVQPQPSKQLAAAPQVQQGKQPPPANKGKQPQSNDVPQRLATQTSKQQQGKAAPPPPPAGKQNNSNNNNNNNNRQPQQQDQTKRGGRGGGRGGQRR